MRFAIMLCCSVSLVLAGCQSVAVEREDCVARAPDFKLRPDQPTAFYEFISLYDKEVWGTTDFSPQEFADFSFPLTWPLWWKNDIRTPVAIGGTFLNSPGCAVGEYTYLRAFGKEFLHVVRLDTIGETLDPDGLVRRTQLNKSHVVRYGKGQSVPILHSPAGDQYIAVSRNIRPVPNVPTLPAGWQLHAEELRDDLEIRLVGTVSVLRMDNEDSFQGPLPVGQRF